MHFAFSYDEEIGCLGAHSLAERLVGAVPRPQAVVVGEPTMMSVVNAQNPGGGIVPTFTGVETPSSLTHLGATSLRRLRPTSSPPPPRWTPAIRSPPKSSPGPH